jgi:hypothetical protein
MKMVRAQNFEGAAKFRDKELELLEQLGAPVHGWTSEGLIYQQQLRAEQWQEWNKRINGNRIQK